MEHSFADLLGDAFSETSGPLFSDEDLDFENLNCDENLEENKTGVSHGNLTTEEDNMLHQEAEEDEYVAENVDKEQSEDENNEDFQSVTVLSMDQIREDYTSSDGDSEQEGSVSGEDEEDEEEVLGTGENPRDHFMSVHCSDEICDGDKEDRIFTEGQPLAPEAAENPQVRNEEQGESGSDGEVSYFERVPERGSDMMMRGDGTEEDEQEEEKEEGEEEEDEKEAEEEEKREDSSDSECEGMKIKQEDDVLARFSEQNVENPCTIIPANPSLEFPEISVQHLQDLITEVDSEDYLEKVKEFSAEEHQEAGESFADYPSDFSSCEYVEGGGNKQERDQHANISARVSDQGSVSKQNTWMGTVVDDLTWTGRSEEAEEEGNEYLYSVDLEADDQRFKSNDVATQERGRQEVVERVFGNVGATGERISYGSSDNEVSVKTTDEERDKRIYVDNIGVQDCANDKDLEEIHGRTNEAFSRWSNAADFNFSWNPDTLTSLLSADLLTTEHTDEAETLFSIVNPAEDDNSYLMVQRGGVKNASPSSQGSVDDSFFFNTDLETSEGMEPGQLGDDEYEEERNWEQEKERIKAFYKFYDDSDGENEREGRQIKVQFCENPLSKVIQFDTDSSDRDSSSSSTDGEEDLSSAETSEELKEADDSSTALEPDCEPPNTEIPESEPDLTITPICTRKHKCLSVLKLIVKMFVVVAMGLLMFWLATDKEGWFRHMSYF